MKTYHFFTLLIFSIISVFTVSGCSQNLQKPFWKPETQKQEKSIVLDGVELTLSMPFIPNEYIFLPDLEDPIQVANFVNRKPYYESMTITAIPFGMKHGAEILPIAGPGMAPVYREILMTLRQEQGHKIQGGPTAKLFGEVVNGIISTGEIYIQVDHTSHVQIVEWVIEGGERIWILRFCREIEVNDGISDSITIKGFEASWIDVELTSPNLDPTRIQNNEYNKPAIIPVSLPESNESDLPFPYWWDGECDTNTYHEETDIWAYPLGGSYRGVKACGPRPWFDNAPDVLVRFFTGSWGVMEWQCVELSMRFLHLAYGIDPYQANGNEVVPHYEGTQLEKINNSTPGIPPQPNDVMSSGPETTYGHSSIVIDSAVDSSGNGTITILEQNSSASGIRTLNVENWEVLSFYTITGWLHDPTSNYSKFFFPTISK